jgi:hypothetical protein
MSERWGCPRVLGRRARLIRTKAHRPEVGVFSAEPDPRLFGPPSSPTIARPWPTFTGSKGGGAGPSKTPFTTIWLTTPNPPAVRAGNASRGDSSRGNKSSPPRRPRDRGMPASSHPWSPALYLAQKTGVRVDIEARVPEIDLKARSRVGCSGDRSGRHRRPCA